LLKTEEIEQKIDILNLTENKKWVSVSAKTGKNVNQLKELIRDIIHSQNSPKFPPQVLLIFSRDSLISGFTSVIKILFAPNALETSAT